MGTARVVDEDVDPAERSMVRSTMAMTWSSSFTSVRIGTQRRPELRSTSAAVFSSSSMVRGGGEQGAAPSPPRCPCLRG